MRLNFELPILVCRRKLTLISNHRTTHSIRIIWKDNISTFCSIHISKMFANFRYWRLWSFFPIGHPEKPSHNRITNKVDLWPHLQPYGLIPNWEVKQSQQFCLKWAFYIWKVLDVPTIKLALITRRTPCTVANKTKPSVQQSSTSVIVHTCINVANPKLFICHFSNNCCSY